MCQKPCRSYIQGDNQSDDNVPFLLLSHYISFFYHTSEALMMMMLLYKHSCVNYGSKEYRANDEHYLDICSCDQFLRRCRHCIHKFFERIIISTNCYISNKIDLFQVDETKDNQLNRFLGNTIIRYLI